LCDAGYKAVDESNFTLRLLASNTTACQACLPGEYGDDPARLTCSVCPSGYVCQGATTKEHPTDIAEDKGYICPKGSYCPLGSSVEIDCPPGTYQPNFGESNSSSCLSCKAGFYQTLGGQDSCFRCSSSSGSLVGSTECTCVGQNRIFQPEDGWCVCRPGYEFVDSNLVVSSESDGPYDCQPIVFPRCADSQVRDSNGDCVSSSSYCASMCGPPGGSFILATGTCDCNDSPTLNEICDEDCRDSALQVTCEDASTLVVTDPTTGTKVSLDLSSLATEGAIDCSNSNSNVYSMGTSDGVFSATFGLGTTLTDQLAQSRRRLDLISPNSDSSLMSRHLSVFNATNSSGVLENPLVCLKLQDSLIFDVSNSNYPEYVKDSLLNTNDNFDYTSFRTLVRNAASTLTVSSFAVTFSEAGTYVFRMSSLPTRLLIVSVMPANVNCSTASHFVEFTASNLVTMGVTSTNDIVLSPDWNLVIGLLLGMLGLVLILLGFMYYFRKRAWISHYEIQSKARQYNRDGKGAAHGSSKGGFFSKKKPHAVYVANSDPEDDLEAAAAAKEAAELNFDDEMLVPELAKHMQSHHDEIDRQMHIQNDLLHELQGSLKKEVDDLKNIITTVTMDMSQNQPPNAQMRKLNALLSRLKVDLSHRSLFEMNLQGTESRVGQMISIIQQLITNGSDPLSESIVSQIADETTRVHDLQASSPDDSVPIQSPVLHHLIEELEDLKEYIDSSLQLTIQEEERRVTNARVTFDQTVKVNNLEVPLVILQGVDKCRGYDSTIDDNVTQLFQILKSFIERSPKLVQTLLTTETSFHSELHHSLGLGNSQLVDDCKTKATESFVAYLEDLRQALALLMSKLNEKISSNNSNRLLSESARIELIAAIDEILSKIPSQSEANIEQIYSLLTDIRDSQNNLALTPQQQQQLAALMASGSTFKPQLVEGESISQYPSVDSEMLETFREDAIPSLIKEKSEITKAIEETVLNRESLSEAQKEEILGGVNTDAKLMQNILDLENERQRETLENVLNSSVVVTGTVTEDEQSIEQRHNAEKEALEKKLEEERNSKLHVLMRGYSAVFESDDVSSMTESKVVTLVGVRYSVKMRRLGVLTRIKYFQFHLKYREIRLRRVLKYLEGLPEHTTKPRTEDFSDLASQFSIKDVPMIQKLLIQVSEEEKVDLVKLREQIISERNTVETFEASIREKWISNTAGIDIGFELSELEDDTRLEFDNLKTLLDQQESYFNSIVQQENDLHQQIQTRKISILDETTREIILKSYLEMEQKYRHQEMKELLQCQVQYLHSVEAEVCEILQLATAWGPKLSTTLQLKSLQERVLLSMQCSQQNHLKFRLTENSLQCEAKEIKLFSDLNRQQASEADINRFIHEQREIEQQDLVVLQGKLSAQYQREISEEKSRQSEAVNDYERELILITEKNAELEISVMISAELSQYQVLYDFKTSLQAKKEYFLQMYQQKTEMPLPEYVLHDLEIQISAEIQREECELLAAYVSLLTGFLISERYAHAMVEGLKPHIPLCSSSLQLSNVRQLSFYRESYGYEFIRKKYKKLVIGHTFREYESRRLILLGRTPEDLAILFADIEEKIKTDIELTYQSVNTEYENLRKQVDEFCDEKIGLQNKYSDGVERVQRVYEENLLKVKERHETERQALRQKCSDEGKDEEHIEIQLLNYNQTAADEICHVIVDYHTELMNSFQIYFASQVSLEKIEESIRELRNKRQQENEVLENALEAIRSSKYEGLLSVQLNRRQNLESKKTEYERELIGLEEQLKQKRLDAHKNLAAQLELRRKARENQLKDQFGLTSSEAKQRAADESENFETAQKAALDELLDQEEKKIRNQIRNEFNEHRDDLLGRVELLQDSLSNPEEGLEGMKLREYQALQESLKKKKEELVAQLIAQGKTPEAAALEADKLIAAETNSQLEKLHEAQTDFEDDLKAVIKSEASIDLQQAKKLREEKILRMKNSIEEKKQSQRKVQTDLMAKKRAGRERQLLDSGIAESDVKKMAEMELMNEELEAMKTLEDKIFEEEKAGLQQIDEDYEAEVDNITRIRDETIAALMNGVNETKRNLKAATTALVNQAKKSRQRQLASLGVPQEEIDALLETEITPEKVLDSELAAIQRKLASAIEEFQDEKLSLFTGELEKALNGLEVAHQVMKTNAKKSLQNRLNKRRAQRKEDLLALGVSPDLLTAELEHDVLPESDMLAQLEQKFDENYEKEYEEQKRRIVSLEEHRDSDDNNLKQREDQEASNLRNKILSDENSNLQQNLDSNLMTVQMTKDMTKKTLEETEKRISSIREQYEEEINRIQAELLAAKKKELETLKAKSAEASELAPAPGVLDASESATEKNEINEKYKLEEAQQIERKKREMEELIQRQLEEEHRRAHEVTQSALEANESAHGKVNQLRKQHEDDLKKLNDQMIYERQLREGHLRSRLAEKKKKFTRAASGVEADEMSEEEIQRELEDEQRRLMEELEEKHARELTAAMMEARQHEMNAAVAAAREAALETEKQLKLKIEQDANQRALERLHASLLDDEKKRETQETEQVRGGKDRLEMRLAEKKARKERELKEQEERALEELAKKQAMEKEEKEKLRQAKMVWSERIQQASSEADEMNLEGRPKEDYCFRETLGKNLVPDTHLSEAAQMIMRSRHLQEMQDLLKIHFEQRVTALKTAVERVMQEKAEARIELVEKLVAREATDEFIKLSLSDLDTRFGRKQSEAEEGAILMLEREHTKQQMSLRQKQLEEISAAINLYSDSTQLAKLNELSEKSHLEMMSDYRSRLAAEKAAREEKIQKEREESEAKLRLEHEESLLKMKQQLQDEEMKEHREIESKRQQLLKEKEAFEKKQQTDANSLHKQEKQRIMETFEKELTAVNEQLVSERKRRKSKLENRLAAQRKNKNEAAAAAKASADPKTLAKAPSVRGLAAVSEEAQESRDSISVASPKRRRSATEIPPALVHSIQVIEGKLQQVIASIQNQSPGGGANPAAIDARLEAYGAKLDKLDRIVALLESSNGLLPSKDSPQQAPPQLQIQLSERMDRLLSTLESTGALQHRIEELSSQMKKQTSDLEAKIAQEEAKEAEKSALSLPQGVYVDSSNPPQGQELIICDEKKLSVQEAARLEFGRQLTSLVGVSEAIQLRAAKSLPPTSNGYENNAFRNSYFYDDRAQVLYIHTNRLSSSGDFGLVAIHALSHIKVKHLPFLSLPLLVLSCLCL
jgi:hypothetical protein